MVIQPASRSQADFPAEMVAKVRADAARDADLVGLFLQVLGVRAVPDKPVRLPARFLRHLRVGLRLFLWELQGFFFHREVGLGKARDVIRDAFLSLDDADADPTALSRTVLRLSVERFAWNGPGELGAEVALDDALEDAALDALAKYLWACRPPVPTTPGPLP